MTPALLEVRGLTVHFPVFRGVLRRRAGAVHAVDGIDLEIRSGETLGLVGESGCGKTTTGRAILRLLRPTAGIVRFDGIDLTTLEAGALRAARRDLQMIFQDPYGSLNPRLSVGAIVREPLDIHRIGSKAQRSERVRELLALVGLSPAAMNRYPRQFSGGQRQRIGIARALATSPRFIVADEPISSLDVSIQAQVVNLLDDLKRQLGLTYLFIAHDLSMVRYLSDRVAVMYLGRIAEVAPRDALFTRPLHPYTQALLSAVPVPDPERRAARQRMILEGDVPDPSNPPAGCRFHTRCPFATAVCTREEPALRTIAGEQAEHIVACHHAERFMPSDRTHPNDEAGPSRPEGTG